MLELHRPGETLLLGAQDGDAIGYGQVPSMLVVGPPGSGKTDCHAKLNVLTYEGSMIVLDIKGDIFKDTAGCKQDQGFKVVRYEPGSRNPESHCYDPLEHIEIEEDTVWQGCRQLTRYLYPDDPGVKDPFWSERAKTLIQLMLCDALCAEAEEDSSFDAVLAALSRGGEIRKLDLEHLAVRARELGIKGMIRAADSFESITSGEAKQLNSFYQVAMSRLAVFDDPLIEKSTQRNDWSPESLRERPTIVYIVIPPEKIDDYAPLLRVVIGQHLDALRRGEVERGELPVTLIIDEAPQLGNFETLVKAVETGRGYGIRVCIYAQTMGQIRKHYADGDSLMAMCAVRCFMNVQSDDAKEVSTEIGMKRKTDSHFDEPLVTAQQLSGPDFADKVVILVNQSHPLQLDKISFYQQGGDVAEAAALPYRFTRSGLLDDDET